MAYRRHFLIGVTTASTIAIAGCSETDLEDLEGVGGNTSNESADDGADENQESNNNEREEDEDTEEQTGPEAAVEQLRTGFIYGDADLINKVRYTDGEEFTNVNDAIEPAEIESIEYEVTELSPADYESQTGNDFAERKIELTETGGDNFAIVKWSEEFIDGSIESERYIERYYLLHQINQEWLIVNNIGTAPTESEGEETEEGERGEIKDYLQGANNFDAVADQTAESTVTVEVGANSGLSFAPAAVKISPDTTVVWKWTGRGGQHNVVAQDGTFESKCYLEEGSSFSHTFESLGVYKYYCTPHRTQGMLGVIEVVEQ
jgi:halocyanin-like protein